MKPKNRLLLFLCACVPGCGQMYQGYMKRGMSLLCAFCAVSVVALGLELAPLVIALVPLWVFAFFDCYNLRARLLDGTAEPDGVLFGLSEMDSAQFRALLRKRNSLVGWVLVVTGVYLLYIQALEALNWSLPDGLYWIYRSLRWDVPKMALTVGVILLGLWFIRGPKGQPVEDIPEFVPPAEPEEPAPAAETAPAEPVPPETEPELEDIRQIIAREVKDHDQP